MKKDNGGICSSADRDVSGRLLRSKTKGEQAVEEVNWNCDVPFALTLPESALQTPMNTSGAKDSGATRWKRRRLLFNRRLS